MTDGLIIVAISEDGEIVHAVGRLVVPVFDLDTESRREDALRPRFFFLRMSCRPDRTSLPPEALLASSWMNPGSD